MVNLRKIGARWETDSNLILTSRFKIVLSEALPHLPSRGADNRILVSVIVRITFEYLDSQSTLLQAFRMARTSVLYNVLEEMRTSLGGPKVGTLQNSGELSKRYRPGLFRPAIRDPHAFLWSVVA
jgi:hypothetical protein